MTRGLSLLARHAAHSRRVRPKRVQDISAGVLLPVAVSDQAPGAIIYDCRPPNLPITVRLRGLRGPCVVSSTALSSLAAPPEGEDLVAGASVPDPATAPEIEFVLSDDPGTNLEDELCHFSPLQEMISPLPESDDVPMSPSRYPAPPVPTMDIYVSETQVSPSQSRVVNKLPTIDVFPIYTILPAVSSYTPATSPVTLSVPVDFDYVSPGNPAMMDRFLAGDRLLMDGPSDLPLLQLPLLPPPVFCLRGLLLALLGSMIIHRAHLRRLSCPGRDLLMHTWIQLLPGMFPWCCIVCWNVNTG